MFALITGTDFPDDVRSKQSLHELQKNDGIAEFCKNLLSSSLQILASQKLSPEALFTICKLAFAYFSKISESRFVLLISCCDELINIMQNKRYLHQYETSIESYLLALISKHPIIQLAELIVKFVGFASKHFNPSRLMRAVLVKSNFPPSQQISLMLPMVRHRAFEENFAQILSDVLLQRNTDEHIDDVTLNFLAKLVLIRRPPSIEIKPSSPLFCLSLASGYHSLEVIQKTVNFIIQPLSDSQATVDRKLSSIIVLPHLK